LWCIAVTVDIITDFSLKNKRGDTTTEEKRTVTFTIVAFRYDQKNSILYRNIPIAEAVPETVGRALVDLKADVISIRRVYEKCPVP